ncbi:hypothetical protein HG531_002923 [Fusarium graminearum]|nr:hypothetical protein HG531_002923 [Fusarium graminearum]
MTALESRLSFECADSRLSHLGRVSLFLNSSTAQIKTPFVQPKPSTTSYSPPPPATLVALSAYFSNMIPSSSSDVLWSLGVSDVEPPVAYQVQKVESRDAAITVVKVVFDTLVSGVNGKWVVLEVVGRSTKPEGVELGRAEEDLLSLGSILCIHHGCILIHGEIDLLRLGSQVVVEIAPKSLVPQKTVHGIASVGSDLAPLLTGTVVSCLLVKVGNGNFVTVQNRVEINRNDVSSVEVSKWEVVVTDSILWTSNPLDRVVETTLSATSEVSVQGLLLLEAELFAAFVDFTGLWRVSSLKNVSVICVLDVGLDHLRQQRRLGTVEVVDSSAISEFSDDGIVDIVEEFRISIEIISGYFFQLIASIVKVFIEKVSKSRIVTERFLELVKSFLDVA